MFYDNYQIEISEYPDHQRTVANTKDSVSKAFMSQLAFINHIQQTLKIDLDYITKDVMENLQALKL